MIKVEYKQYEKNVCTLPQYKHFASRNVRTMLYSIIKKENVDQYKRFKVKVEAPPNRKNLVFFGASYFGDTVRNNPSCWVTKEQYEEVGAQVIHNQMRH